MVICPKCKTICYLLRFSSKIEQFGNFYSDRTETKEYGDWSEFKASCPECDAVLFTDYDKAEEFLTK